MQPDGGALRRLYLAQTQQIQQRQYFKRYGIQMDRRVVRVVRSSWC